jgi:hypothetical protein
MVGVTKLTSGHMERVPNRTNAEYHEFVLAPIHQMHFSLVLIFGFI